MSYLQGDKPISITKLLAMHTDGEKIAVLTAYDSTMSALLNRCGVEVILIGDSLGNVIQGHSSTTPVTVEEMAYHTECVARANHHAFLIADLPFASYGDPVQALESAAELMRAGADMVKLEGGSWQIDVIQFLVERSVPVCAHLGLLPQSVHLLGGYKVQGKSKDSATQMFEQAHACQAAGAQMLVLEAIPSALGEKITQSLHMTTRSSWTATWPRTTLPSSSAQGCTPGTSARASWTSIGASATSASSTNTPVARPRPTR